jgi:mannitol/fructose-specific phosphotransferase system IIA component (Ntr-type)
MDELSEKLERVAMALGFLVTHLSEDAAQSAETAVRFLMGHLVTAGLLDTGNAATATDTVLARERQGSTAVGRGLALPHGAVPFVERVVGALAHCPSGVPWESVDGEPVRLVLLTLTPLGRPRDLRTLELLAQALQHN